VHLPGDQRTAFVLAHGFTLSWQHGAVWKVASRLREAGGVAPAWVRTKAPVPKVALMNVRRLNGTCGMRLSTSGSSMNSSRGGAVASLSRSSATARPYIRVSDGGSLTTTDSAITDLGTNPVGEVVSGVGGILNLEEPARPKEHDLASLKSSGYLESLGFDYVPATPARTFRHPSKLGLTP